MLKRDNRISRNKDFDRVFKAGQSFYGRVLGIKTVHNNLDHNRLGILISTKVSKKAVVRNIYKRRLRAIVGQELPVLKNGYDLVLIVFPLILEKNYSELTKIVETGFKRLNLYK
jgi:ribonuclease P protein component